MKNASQYGIYRAAPGLVNLTNQVQLQHSHTPTTTGIKPADALHGWSKYPTCTQVSTVRPWKQSKSQYSCVHGPACQLLSTVGRCHSVQEWHGVANQHITSHHAVVPRKVRLLNSLCMPVNRKHCPASQTHKSWPSASQASQNKPCSSIYANPQLHTPRHKTTKHSTQYK